MPTLNLYLDKHVKKNGECPILLCVLDNKKKKYFSLQISVLPKDWDNLRREVKKTHKSYLHLNTILANLYNKAQNLLYKYAVEGSEFDFDIFYSDFSEKPKTIPKKNQLDFYAFAEKEIANMHKRDISISTIKHYKVIINKLKGFKTSLQLTDFTYKFLVEYEHYMRTTLNYHKNTIAGTMQKINTLLISARKQKMISDSGFVDYKIKVEQTERIRLMPNELERLQKIWDERIERELNTNQINVLRYFLFCCYTGLRYSDVCTLRWSHIQHDMITKRMEKTQTFVYIPLTDYSKPLLPNKKCIDELVFDCYCNQITNRILKEIAKLALIQKNLTSHVGRHTFATMCASKRMGIETTSDLLGHKSLRMTQIYYKISNARRKDEMNEVWQKNSTPQL